MKKTALIILGIIILILLIVLYLPKVKKQSAINQNLPVPSETAPSETQPSALPQTQEPTLPSETTPTATPTIPGSSSQEPQPKQFEIKVTNSKFNVNKIEIKSGEDVVIRVINNDDVQYAIGWREQELQRNRHAIGALVPKDSLTLNFKAPEKKGEYCLLIDYPFGLANLNDCTGSAVKVFVK